MSNTEQMVSDNQREWLKTMADAIQHADGKPMPVDPIVADLLRALIAQPATQPLGWVYDGGQEFTSDPDRAHDLRAEGIELTAVYGHAQHQREPVALPARKDTTQHWAEPGGVHKAEGWNAYHEELARLGPLYTHPAPFQQGEPVAFYREFVDGREYCEKPFTNDWTPLYTHADAGEVERLRDQLLELAKTIHKRHYAKSAPDFEPFDFSSGLIGQIDNMVAGMLQDLSTLRAQLAERDALLADAANLAMFTLPEDWHTRYAALSASAEPKSCGACANGCISGCQLEKDSPPIDAGITASVERDERAEFESWVETRKVCTHKGAKLHKDRAGSYLDYRINDRWLTWQARAALERKP